MTARQVTAELKRQFWPLVIDLGFAMEGTRNAKRIRGPVTAFVSVHSLTSRLQELHHVPPGSFGAAVGLDLMGGEPASFMSDAYEVPDFDSTSTRLTLMRSIPSKTSVQPYVWSLGDLDAAEAVEDLCWQFTRHANHFLEVWDGAQSTYRQLAGTDPSPWPTRIEDAQLGGATISFPGRPGSILRLRHLAVLAARFGEVDAERQHLQNLQRHHEEPRVKNRLEQLDGIDNSL